MSELRNLPGLSAKQERAADDALDILDAAGLAAVMVIGVDGRHDGGVLTNMDTGEALTALADAMAHMKTDAPHVTTPGSVQ